MGTVRVNPVGQLKGRGIKLKHRQITELITVGIEELVVVDGGVLPENPFAAGIQIGLSGLTLDPIAQRVLPLVSARQIKLVEEKQACRQQAGSHQHGHDDAINAGPRSLDGGNFVGALHQSKGDEHGQQDAQMRDVVKKIGRHVQQVFPHHQRRDPVTQDIRQQVEHGKHQQQREKRGQDHRQIEEKIPQDIVVQNHGKARAKYPPPAGRPLESIFRPVRSEQTFSAILQFRSERIPSAAQPYNLKRALFRPPQ